MLIQILAVFACAAAGFGTYLVYFSLVAPGDGVAKLRLDSTRFDWIQVPHNKLITQYTDLARVCAVKLELWQFVTLSLLGSAVGAGLVLALTQLAVLSGLAGIFVMFLPLITLRMRREKVTAQRGNDWPHLVDNLVSGVRAGLSLGETLLQVSATAPASLAQPFAAFATDYRTRGNLDAALSHLKAGIADPVADRIIEALRLAGEVGGNQLVALLEDLGAMLRAEGRTRGEVLARQSWTVTGARLAAVAPWVILGLLLTRGQTYEVYSTPTGTLILVVGAAVSLGAYLLMIRLGLLDPNPRTMRG